MKRKPLQLLIKKSLTFLLLVNFINLSANFYLSSSHDNSNFAPTHDDPMDTVAELVLEYVMEMPDDTIPDTEAPTSDKNQKLKDLKVYYLPIWFSLQWVKGITCLKKHGITPIFLKSIHLDISSPPPRLG